MNNFIEAAKQLSGAHNFFLGGCWFFIHCSRILLHFQRYSPFHFIAEMWEKNYLYFTIFLLFGFSGNWALHMSLKIVRAWACGDRIPDCSAKMHERILRVDHLQINTKQKLSWNHFSLIQNCVQCTKNIGRVRLL